MACVDHDNKEFGVLIMQAIGILVVFSSILTVIYVGGFRIHEKYMLKTSEK